MIANSHYDIKRIQSSLLTGKEFSLDAERTPKRGFGHSCVCVCIHVHAQAH